LTKETFPRQEKDMTTMTLDYARPSRMAWRNLARRAIPLLGIWYQRARQRRQLVRIDDRQLRDIGLSRGVARREANKAFWQA
jgi:uncharacterized protein YjiS (DUF1127 family)